MSLMSLMSLIAPMSLMSPMSPIALILSDSLSTKNKLTPRVAYTLGVSLYKR